MAGDSTKSQRPRGVDWVSRDFVQSLQRWTGPEIVQADGRTTIARPAPRNALSEVERQVIVTLCNSADYAHLPPSQIVPRLADQGRYLASESTFYRV